MAKITPGSIRKYLVDNYVYKGSEELERAAQNVYDRFVDNVRADIGGAYGAALESAEREGVIEKKPANPEPRARTEQLEFLTLHA